MNGKAKQELLTRYYYLHLKNTLFSSMHGKITKDDLFDYDKYRKYVLSPYPDIDRVERCTAVEMLIKEKVKPVTKLTEVEYSEFVGVNLEVFQIKSIFSDNENGNAKAKKSINVKDYVKRLQALPKEVEEKIRENLEMSRPALCEVSGVYIYLFEYAKIKHLVNYFNRIYKNKRSELKKYVVEKDDTICSFQLNKRVKERLEMLDYTVTEGDIFDTIKDKENNTAPVAIRYLKDDEPKSSYTISLKNNLINAEWPSDFQIWEVRLFMFMASLVQKNDVLFQEIEISIDKLEKFFDKRIANYKSFRKTLEQLYDKKFTMKNEFDKHNTTLIHIFSKMKFNDNPEEFSKHSSFKVQISEEMKPFMLLLKDHYTSGKLAYFKKLKNPKSIPLYLNLKQPFYNNYKHKDKIIYEISKLRNIIGINKTKNDRYNDYIKVIQRSVDEINEHTDIDAIVDGIKTSRKVNKVQFTIKLKANSKPSKKGLNLNKEDEQKKETFFKELERFGSNYDKEFTPQTFEILIVEQGLESVMREAKEAMRKIQAGDVPFSYGYIYNQIKLQIWENHVAAQEQKKKENQKALALEKEINEKKVNVEKYAFLNKDQNLELFKAKNFSDQKIQAILTYVNNNNLEPVYYNKIMQTLRYWNDSEFIPENKAILVEVILRHCDKYNILGDDKLPF